jgi:Flp pilus assembly protein TadG
MIGILSTKQHFRAGIAALCKKIVLLRSNQKGASALEFSLFAGILIFGVLNIVDISIYIFQRMQVENAAQVAVQAAWKECDPSKGYLPATTSCPDLTTSITNAAQSTSLGNQIAIQQGSPSEGYYCLNTSGALQLVATATNDPPADCSATGVTGMTPADYIQVTTTFPYTPLFTGITVASAFATPIIKTGTMRLN